MGVAEIAYNHIKRVQYITLTKITILLSLLLTISLLILSFSILSVSFFCSRSVLACQVATALESF